MASLEAEDVNSVEMSAVDIQQEYFEAVGDADWELYEKKDRHRLLQKVAIALCGPPTEEGDLSEESLKLQGYDPRSEDITMKVFNKICEQDKYSHNGKNILVSILRVVCVTPSKDIPLLKREPVDYWVDLHKKKGKDVIISIFHVFSLRKCISLEPGVQSCRVFIDHDARVYKDWKSYLTENKLPKSVMVVPENGKYKGVVQNEHNGIPTNFENFTIPDVILTIIPSPALGIGAKILSIADTTNTVVGIGSLVTAVGLMAAPVAVPMAVGTVLVAGAVTSIYGIVRSSIHLADRGKHEQDISLMSSEARASWLNILVSSAGLSLSAAGKLVSWAASTGTNIKILINAVQFLKYTTIASGLLGVVNGLGEMIYKYTQYNEKPTKLELFQFTSSLLFFGIGVMSNQTAQEIVEDAQAKSINNIRESLTSKAKRKMFDKITAETRRVQGTIQGNADVIKGLKTITNKNEFFAKLSKMNKQLNINKLRISLSSDGSTLINNQYQMTLTKLTELGKAGRDNLFATFGPAKLVSKNVPTRLYTLTATAPQVAPVRASYLTNIRPEELYKITSFVYSLCTTDKNLLCKLLSEMTSDVHQAFMLLCIELINSLITREIECLSFLGSDWKIRVIYYIYDYLMSKIDFDDADYEMSFENLLKEFLVYGRIKTETLENLKDMVIIWICEKRDKPCIKGDPRNFDGIFELRRKLQNKYKTLKAGHVVKIGNHSVLIKALTIEKLHDYLALYPQEDCDLFLELCFTILSAMTTEELKELNLINLDEDVIMRISSFLMDWNVVEETLKKVKKNGVIDTELIVQLKVGVIDWARVEKSRNHETCNLCKGIRYCD